MSSTVNEVTGTANYKEFKQLLKRFKTVRILNSHRYWKVSKCEILNTLNFESEMKVTYEYWEEHNDVIWIDKIVNHE